MTSWVEAVISQSSLRPYYYRPSPLMDMALRTRLRGGTQSAAARSPYFH